MNKRQGDRSTKRRVSAKTPRSKLAKKKTDTSRKPISHATVSENVSIYELVAEDYRLREAAHLLSMAPIFMTNVLTGMPTPKAVWHARFVARRFLQLTAQSPINHKASLRAMWSAIRKGNCKTEVIKRLQKPLAVRSQAIADEAALIAPSTDKARSYLEACIDYDNYLGPAIEAIAALPNYASASHPTVEALLNSLRQDRIESAPLGHEDEHSLSWHLFLERFGSGEVKSAEMLVEIERGFRGSIQQQTWEIEEQLAWRHQPDVTLSVQLLWTVGRSRALSHLLHRELAKLANVVAAAQDASGYWVSWTYGGERGRDRKLEPNVRTTALCLLALSRFQSRTRSTGSLQKAAAWLCREQETSGGWACESTRDADVLTTALVVQALIVSGVPLADKHVKRGKAYLLANQDPLGCWYQRGWPPTLLTGIVLEAFAAEPLLIPAGVDNKFLRAARELLPRGQWLLESEDSGDWPLGVIAVYHGLESLLYGCFLNMKPPIGIYRQNSTRTIGLGEALTAFAQRHAAAGGISFEPQVRTIASDRDGIVHQGDDITPEAKTDVLRHAIGFVRANHQRLLPPGVSLETIWPGIPLR